MKFPLECNICYKEPWNNHTNYTSNKSTDWFFTWSRFCKFHRPNIQYEEPRTQ